MEFNNEYHFFMSWIAATFCGGDKVKAVVFLARQHEEDKQEAMRLLREKYTIVHKDDGRVFVPELS